MKKKREGDRFFLISPEWQLALLETGTLEGDSSIQITVFGKEEQGT